MVIFFSLKRSHHRVYRFRLKQMLMMSNRLEHVVQHGVGLELVHFVVQHRLLVLELGQGQVQIESKHIGLVLVLELVHFGLGCRLQLELGHFVHSVVQFDDVQLELELGHFELECRW